jgi:hypothetical protein
VEPVQQPLELLSNFLGVRLGRLVFEDLFLLLVGFGLGFRHSFDQLP